MSIHPIIAAAIGGALLLVTLAALRWRRLKSRRQFIDTYAFPPGITARVQKRYPHLSEADLTEVMAALRQYFHLALQARKRPLSMPSQAVDMAWHEFILFTRNYEHFCRRALGRYLHHTPAEAMRSPTEAQEGIRRAWRLACAQENLSPRTPPRLPRLFALDDRLQIPDGFRYALNCMAPAAAAAGGTVIYCGSHIGCGSGGGDGGCAGDSGCSGDGGGGCGGGGD